VAAALAVIVVQVELADHQARHQRPVLEVVAAVAAASELNTHCVPAAVAALAC
jgi:hypothetical protein